MGHLLGLGLDRQGQHLPVDLLNLALDPDLLILQDQEVVLEVQTAVHHQMPLPFLPLPSKLNFPFLVSVANRSFISPGPCWL